MTRLLKPIACALLVPFAIVVSLWLTGCSSAPPPRSPADALALAGRSGPELTAASLALDAGVVLTASAAGARCPDEACRARATVEALEPYLATAEALRWAAAAQRSAARPGEPLAVAPDVMGVLARLGFEPKASTPGEPPDLFCNQWICVANPGGGGPGPGGPAPAPGNNPPPPPVPKP
jgi:hypothetical protein